MAQTRSSGFDRFNDALKSLDEQLQDLRERFDQQRRRVEREVRKRAEKLQTRVQETDLYKRAEGAEQDPRCGSRSISADRLAIAAVPGIPARASVYRRGPGQRRRCELLCRLARLANPLRS